MRLRFVFFIGSGFSRFEYRLFFKFFFRFIGRRWGIEVLGGIILFEVIRWLETVLGVVLSGVFKFCVWGSWWIRRNLFGLYGIGE